MKKMILILTMLFSFAGCRQEEPEQQLDTNSIYGTWQLVESFSHPPTGTGWEKVEDGFKLELKNNGSFISNEFQECQIGTHEISEKNITFNYSCEGFTTKFEEPRGTFSYQYYLNQDTSMIELSPVNFICYEGCKYRLVKIR